MQDIEGNLAGSIFDMGKEGPQVCGPACCLGPACCPRGVIATYLCTHAALVIAATRHVDQLTWMVLQRMGGTKTSLLFMECPFHRASLSQACMGLGGSVRQIWSAITYQMHTKLA